jgi:hypothetical protein
MLRERVCSSVDDDFKTASALKSNENDGEITFVVHYGDERDGDRWYPKYITVFVEKVKFYKE